MSRSYYGKDGTTGAGRTIRMLRERLDLTQAMLAKKLGVSSSLIGQIERGTAKVTDAMAFDLSQKFDGLQPENFTDGVPVNWSSVR